MQTHPVKVLEIKAEHYRTISSMPTFNGSWASSVNIETIAYEKQPPLPESPRGKICR